MNYQTDLQKQVKITNPTRDKIITQLYERKDLKAIIKKIAKTKYLIEELTGELFLAICKMPEETLIRRYNLPDTDNQYLDFWILGALKNMFNSETSPFYEKIKKHETGKTMTAIQKQKYLISEDPYTKERNLYLDCLERAITRLKEYDRNAIALYLQYRSFKAVSQKTGIRPEYVSQIIERVKDELRTMISDDVRDHYNNEMFPMEDLRIPDVE